MRWKFLVIVSLAAAIIACALWSAAVVVFFGPARLVNLGGLWFISFVIPLAISSVAGFFVYRHTSRRRKLQATVAILAVLILTASGYFAAAKLLPHYLAIPPSKSHRS